MLATWLRHWLGARFGVTATYVTYYPAVLLLASSYGIARGIWATVLSVLCVDFFFLRPTGSLFIIALGDRIGLAFFFAFSMLLSVVAGALRGQTERLRDTLQELNSSRERARDDQRRLHEAATHFDTVLAAADEAITSIDSSGILTSWNKGAEAMFGYAAAEMIGRPFRKLLPRGAAADAEARDILARLGRGETVEKQNILRIGQDGRMLRVNLTVTPVRDAAGNIAGASAVTRDITERVNLQKDQRRLHEATTRLDTVLASSEEAIIGKDIHGLVTSWNKGAETIFGYTAEEMVGQPIGKLLPPDRQHEEEDILNRILRNEPVDMSDAIRIAKGGHTVHVRLHVSPVRDEAGNIIGASKIAHDITETVKLQRQLQQSQKMEAIGQLAGGIAHDFNNLLAIVLGALELQRASIDENPSALHRWEVANRAAMRGAELTRRLLAFSSVEHFKMAATDLNHSIRNTMEMASRLLGPEITVDLKLEKGMTQVLADPSGLESAVLNMVINARDAMPKGGRLTVSTRTADLERSFTQTLTGAIEPGTYACISITDTGTGMPQEVLDRACEPFFTTKERGRGTGLGLSMVYGFVKHSGGGIRIYSEVGYGTTITFYLPFDTADKPTAEADRAVPAKQTNLRRAGRILIVDDEGELLDISVSYLAARGYTLLSANSGSEALDLLSEKGAVDVLVTDIVMGGGMDGMELAQAVRGLYPETRIIYSSGFPADALSTRSLPLADSLVLQKPYRLSELSSTIDQALGIRQILTTGAAKHAAPVSEDAFAAPASSNPFN